VLHVLVLGAAAGGGFPQWNCNDDANRRARANDPNIRPRTQSSIAVSADGKRWVVLNASPDLRQQINDNKALHPSADDPKRASPIAAVVVTNADVDHVTGLLNLRESQPLALYGHSRVLGVLAQNTIFNVLNPAFVDRRPLSLDVPLPLADKADAPLGITVTAFVVPGKIALWLEDLNAPGFGSQAGDTIGLMLTGADGSDPVFYIPGCASMPPELKDRLNGAALVFFDGTLWSDDEMIASGVGVKSGQRMGHMSCSGPDGVIAAFAELDVGRKVFIHLNNTNPLLIDNSPECAEAARAGWDVAYDGMELTV
jgi:pyrroloquinoline quinone biosynthesis protein B